MLLVAGLGTLTAFTHGRGLANGPAFGDDEGTYVAQAWAVQHHGTLAHYTYWYDHPPLGWLVLAGWNVLTGRLLHPSTAVQAGRQAMLVLAVASAVLLFILARRMGLGRLTAALAVLLYALSPLAVAYTRMVFLDNVAVPFLLGAFVLALSPRRHLWAHMGSGLCLAAAVLSKETFLLFAPVVFAAAWRAGRGRTRPFLTAGFACAFLLVLSLYPVFAFLKGELIPGPAHVSLIDGLHFQLLGRPSTGSVLQIHSLSANVVRGWLRLDPWLLGGGVLLCPLAVLVRRTRLAGLAVLVPTLVALRPGYLPESFVVALLPFCALVIAGLAAAAARRCSTSQMLLRRSTRPLGDGRWRVRRRPTTVGLAVAAAVALGVLCGSTRLLGVWTRTTHQLDAGTANTQTRAVEQWIAANVPTAAHVLTDDTMWVDLVNRGFDPKTGAIWFYKLDSTADLVPPAVRRQSPPVPYLNYVISSPILRSALDRQAGLPLVRQAVQSSHVVTVIGTGDSRVEIRAID
ncbi:MAG: ArnT family glycosyltransferase [Frankiaceae bacterium]